MKTAADGIPCLLAGVQKQLQWGSCSQGTDSETNAGWGRLIPNPIFLVGRWGKRSFLQVRANGLLWGKWKPTARKRRVALLSFLPSQGPWPHCKYLAQEKFEIQSTIASKCGF